MTSKQRWGRGSIVLGLIATGLGCYGAFEFALKQEGGQVSYLVIAAPVIAAAAALIPPIAEDCWRNGMYLKCLLWWLILVPAAATVFFASSERVHVAKSGAEAERAAYHKAVDRATSELAEAKAEQTKAQAAVNKAEGRGDKGPKLETPKATLASAKVRLDEAKSALMSAERSATEESPMTAPVWLLPAALDLIAFMAIWTGLTGPRPPEPVAMPVTKKRAKKKTGAKTRGTKKTTVAAGYGPTVVEFPVKSKADNPGT